MIDQHMKASIEVTGLQMVRGSIQAHELINLAVRDLLNGGGSIGKELAYDRDATRFTYVGTPELVQPVIAAFMAFIKSTEP